MEHNVSQRAKQAVELDRADMLEGMAGQAEAAVDRSDHKTLYRTQKRLSAPRRVRLEGVKKKGGGRTIYRRRDVESRWVEAQLSTDTSMGPALAEQHGA